jgi:hypothetical protein
MAGAWYGASVQCRLPMIVRFESVSWSDSELVKFLPHASAKIDNALHVGRSSGCVIAYRLTMRWVRGEASISSRTSSAVTVFPRTRRTIRALPLGERW